MPGSPESPHVLHISTWGIPCGIATYCDNLVAALGLLGVENDVHPLSPYAWKAFLPSDVRRLEDEIIEHARRVDLVHIQHEHGLFGLANGACSATRNYGRILSGILRVGRPVVTTFHTAPLEGKRHTGVAAILDPIRSFNRQRTWRSRVGKPFAAARGRAAALVHSATTRRALVRSGITESAVSVIPHGCLTQRDQRLDPAAAKRALGISSDEKLVTIFGFIGRYKGHDLAVKTLLHLPGHYRLAICGGVHPETKDTFFERLLKLIDTLGLRDRVTITGWLPAKEADVFYAATDVCLAPYREVNGGGLSASGAVTWALSSGRPTVASKIDAFQAIQREASCMLMTTPEQPQEIAWAVEAVARDAALSRRLVEAATAFCDRHSWDAVAEATVGIYRETMAAHPTRKLLRTFLPRHETKTESAVRHTPPDAPTSQAPRMPSNAFSPRTGETLRDAIRASQSLDGWCPLDKAMALADLVLEAKPACIAEIGVYGGRSAIPMALAARTYGGQVHGIDPWSREAALEGDVGEDNRSWWNQLDIESIYQRFLSGISRFGVQDTLRLHRTTDTTALREFADGQIGILHVDGNHSAEVSRRYVEQWGPKIAAGGYLIMDDIDWATQAQTVALIESSYEPVRKETTWAIYRKPSAASGHQRPLAA